MSDYTARLDLARLAELRELDESYVDQAIGRFLLRAPDDFTVLDDAVASGDRAQLAMVSHRLAGAALNLGAGGLGRAAQSLEDLVIRGTTDKITTVMQQLAQELHADVEALRAYQRECLSPLPA